MEDKAHGGELQEGNHQKYGDQSPLLDVMALSVKGCGILREASKWQFLKTMGALQAPQMIKIHTKHATHDLRSTQEGFGAKPSLDKIKGLPALE